MSFVACRENPLRLPSLASMEPDITKAPMPVLTFVRGRRQRRTDISLFGRRSIMVEVCAKAFSGDSQVGSLLLDYNIGW